MAPIYLDGVYYRDGGFHRGCVAIVDGTVSEITGSPPAEPLARGIICPSMWNCHTHVGDAYFKPPEGAGLEELVAWPGGLKHRAHRETPGEMKHSAIREFLGNMAGGGVAGLIDFREEGVPGIEILDTALKDLPLGRKILGRPASLPGPTAASAGEDDTWREEAAAVLGVSDGFGLSGIADVPGAVLAELSDMARSAGKDFAIHASEGEREDIDAILDLRPTHIVHLTMGTGADMERVADAGIPVAMCPTSNLRFGRRPDVTAMKGAGIDLALGTDNAMFGPPDLIGEARALYELGRGGGMAPSDALRVLFEGPGKLLSPAHRIRVEPGFAGGITVFGGSLEDPCGSLLGAGGGGGPVYISPPAPAP